MPVVLSRQLKTTIIEIEHTTLNGRALNRADIVPWALTPHTAPGEIRKLKHKIRRWAVMGVTMRLSGNVTEYGKRSEHRRRPALPNESTEDLRDFWEAGHIGPKTQHTPSPVQTSKE